MRNLKSIKLEQTIRLLEVAKGHRKEVAKATGLGYDWLGKLSRGEFKDPGIRKIEHLHAYLKARYKVKGMRPVS